MASFLDPARKIDHLLFDLDGTLIDSGGMMVHFEFIWRTLPLMKDHQGWRAAYSALKASKSILDRPSKDQTNLTRTLDKFSKHLKISKASAEKELLQNLRVVFPKLKPHFGKIKGAASFLDWAKEHYHLTLATNPVWIREFVEMRMKWGGISPEIFPWISTADLMHACKPTPEYYEEVLRHRNLTPSQCLMIGNERKMDLPATHVGIPVFLIRPDTELLTCIERPTSSHPGAWRGNYSHLKKFLIDHQAASSQT